MSKYDEKSKAYTIAYIKEKYDEVKLRLPAGSKENLRAHIEKYGPQLPENCRSMQGFIKAAINEKMLSDMERYGDL